MRFTCLNISHSQMSKQTVQFYSTLITVHFIPFLICKRVRLTCLKIFYGKQKKKQCQTIFNYPFSSLYILYDLIFEQF